MRPLVVWAALLAGALVVAALWLRGDGAARVEGAAPPAATVSAPPPAAALVGVELVEIAGDLQREPAAAATAAGAGAPTTPSATASIRGTVRRQLHTYHPEVVDRVRATFEAGVVPTPEELEQAWEQLGLPLEVVTVEPLAGVKVTVEPARSSPLLRSALRVVTDGAGRYSVDDLPPGRYALRVVAPRGSPRLPHDDPRVHRSVYLDAGELEEVVFDLPREEAALTGRVLDAAGRAVEGAEVTAGPFVIPEVGIPQELRTETDAQGRYRLSGLRPASLQRGIEQALASARTGMSEEAIAVVSERAMTVVNVVARGHVPARLLVLPLSEERERSASSVVERLHSWKQAVGKVEWLPFDLGRPYAGGSRPVFESSAQVLPDIVLAREASVSGSVVDSRGAFLPLAEVRMGSADAPSAQAGLLTPASVPPGWTRTDGRGGFHLSGIPSGSYTFEVRTEAAGLQRATNPPLVVAEGATLRDVQVLVRTDEKGFLAGTAVDARSGEPLQDFRLEVGTTQGWTLEDGEDGSFLVDKVQEGPVTVLVHARGYASETLECVVRGGETTELSAALARAGHLQGNVLLDGDFARGMLSVYVDGGSGERVHYGWFDGRYQTPRLRPGRPYRLVAEVQLAPGSTSKLVAHAVAVPADDEDTEFDLRLTRPVATLTGEVRIGGEPQAWFVYALEGGASGLDDPLRSPLLRAVAEGRRSSEEFELALAPGTYTLLWRVLRKDPRGGPPLREDQVRSVQVAEGDDAHIALEAP